MKILSTIVITLVIISAMIYGGMYTIKTTNQLYDDDMISTTTSDIVSDIAPTDDDKGELTDDELDEFKDDSDFEEIVEEIITDEEILDTSDVANQVEELSNTILIPYTELPLDQYISFTDEDIQELDEFIETLGEGISVYFYDVDSKLEYIYNGDEKYRYESVVKAPYCMYLLDLASLGLLDLDAELVYKEAHYFEGTGKIQFEEFGAIYTIRELIERSLADSDNVAINILREYYPTSNFTTYATKFYDLDHPEDIHWVLDQVGDVKDMGAYAKGIYEFIRTNEYGDMLKEDMQKSKNIMISSTYPVVHKYGWGALGFNDMAIVYSPNPYILAICTDHVEGTWDDYLIFRKISAKLEEIQSAKYA